jgi:spore maturation protein CgeB
MKILVLNSTSEGSLGSSYARAFRLLGHEVVHLDPETMLRKRILWRNKASRRVLERSLIAQFNREWLDGLASVNAELVWVGKGAWALPRLWEEYKAKRPQTKLVCYNADDPITTFSRGANRPWVTESIRCFDLFCTYNQALAHPLRERGAKRVAVIPFAWDPELHPYQRTESFNADIVFIGNGDAHREAWLASILEQDWARRAKISIFGVWNGVKSDLVRQRIHATQKIGSEMAKIIAGSRVSLNILRLQNEGSHNMRTFETPGCGGLNASQYSQEQDMFFPSGEASYYFRSPEEAGVQLEAAIRDDRRNREMRRAVHSIVTQHTYEQRARLLLEHSC